MVRTSGVEGVLRRTAIYPVSPVPPSGRTLPDAALVAGGTVGGRSPPSPVPSVPCGELSRPTPEEDL